VSAPQVLVVGSVNVDLIMNVPALPGPGETVLGGTFAQGGGGKGANQAVAAARAGARTLLAGAVGDDEHGRGERAALAAAGVDVTHLATVDGAPTGVAFVVVDRTGANQIAVASGANALVDADAAAAAVRALDPARSAVLLSFEVADAPLVAAAREAATRGIPLVANPAPARAPAAALLAVAPILTPNEPEARALGGADALAERTGAPVVVTRGALGAVVVAPGGGVPVTVAAPVVDVVDTTGAGDVFSGVLAAALAARRALPDAVAEAVAAASQSVAVAGAR
jgi:ribokinase